MLLLGILGIGGALWELTRSAPGTTNTVINGGPAQIVDYWLTVQRRRDSKDYKEPFDSSGQEIFENGWRSWVNIQSAQPGVLYLLNEGIGTQHSAISIADENGIRAFGSLLDVD